MSPFNHLFHLHPAFKSSRITVSLHNVSHTFQDVTIDGHAYTISANRWLRVSGPAGTTVVADSNYGTIHRGDTLAVLKPQLDQTTVVVR